MAADINRIQVGFRAFKAQPSGEIQIGALELHVRARSGLEIYSTERNDFTATPGPIRAICIKLSHSLSLSIRILAVAKAPLASLIRCPSCLAAPFWRGVGVIGPGTGIHP